MRDGVKITFGEVGLMRQWFERAIPVGWTVRISCGPGAHGMVLDFRMAGMELIDDEPTLRGHLPRLGGLPGEVDPQPVFVRLIDIRSIHIR